LGVQYTSPSELDLNGMKESGSIGGYGVGGRPPVLSLHNDSVVRGYGVRGRPPVLFLHNGFVGAYCLLNQRVMWAPATATSSPPPLVL
jgi:hypothetical protein